MKHPWWREQRNVRGFTMSVSSQQMEALRKPVDELEMIVDKEYLANAILW